MKAHQFKPQELFCGSILEYNEGTTPVPVWVAREIDTIDLYHLKMVNWESDSYRPVKMNIDTLAWIESDDKDWFKAWFENRFKYLHTIQGWIFFTDDEVLKINLP